mgnify:CR=1 FL=1
MERSDTAKILTGMEGKGQAAPVAGVKFAIAKVRPWRKWLARVGALVAAILITLIAFLTRDWIRQFAVYGYPGVFLVSLLGNATVFIPAPSYAIVFAVGGTLNPLLTGIVAGLGAALGELTGYLAGTSGRAVVTSREAYERFEPLMRRYGVFAIAVLAAIPNPFFDVAGILSGMLRIPVWQFVLAAWVGKSMRFTLLAYGGASSLLFLENFLQGV